MIKKIEEFCDLPHPYQLNEQTTQLMLEAMREAIIWHQKRSLLYGRLMAAKNFSVEHLKSSDDLEKVPFIIANFFKSNVEKSIDDEDIYLHLTSSGTTGQKSQIFFDKRTITQAQGMVDKIFTYYGWNNPEQECNYLLYTYAPKLDSKLGTAYTDNFLCKYTKIKNVFYALKLTGEGEHKFDLFGTLEILHKYAAEGLPVRIFGFPAFFYFTLNELKKGGMIDLKLHPDSLVFLGGGWKNNQKSSIEKSHLYFLANQLLGIPDERLRDGFGSVEHCIPYVECKNHKFHIPIWSKVFIRDVKTLQSLGYGKVGYVNFVSPYITSMPAISVLMQDLGVLHRGEECSCELSADYFELAGRAGISKNRSCAVAASELLNEF